MTAPVTSAPAGPEGTGTPSIPVTPVVVTPIEHQSVPGESAIKAAGNKAREHLAARDAARAANPAVATTPTPPDATLFPPDPVDPLKETAEEKDAREVREAAALLTETDAERIEREAREAREAGAASGTTDGADPELDDAAMTVELPPHRDGAQPLNLVAGDPESLERLRALVKGFTRGEQARAIREDAQRLRSQADEFGYTMQLDPAGVLTETVKDPNDQAHMLRYLLTRPGVFEAHKDWLEGLLTRPEAIVSEAKIADSERITRRDEVRGKVETQRKLDDNARSIVQSLERSITSLAPAAWSDEQKGMLYDDVLQDVRRFRQDRNLEMVDPRLMPGMIQRRLALLGVAPRSEKDPTPAPAAAVAGNGAPAKPAAAPPQTAEKLRAARAAKAAAASAPPGAGSAVPSLQAPPKYDPAKPGSPIQQAAANARAWIKGLAKRPQ